MAKSKKTRTKVKASRNTAADVEQKRTQQSTEELAFALNQNYAQLIQAQANIRAINTELEKRQLAKAKEKEQTDA